MLSGIVVENELKGNALFPSVWTSLLHIYTAIVVTFTNIVPFTKTHHLLLWLKEKHNSLFSVSQHDDA